LDDLLKIGLSRFSPFIIGTSAQCIDNSAMIIGYEVR
jgi:hypothetical protein